MRFLIDMGLATGVARWLRGRGHDAVHIRAEGLQRLPDPEIFEKAVAEDRIILTVDLDFTEIAALSRGSLTSVVVFRLRNPRAQRVLERLQSILPAVTEALEAGAVVLDLRFLNDISMRTT